MILLKRKNKGLRKGFSFIEVMLTLALFMTLSSVGVGAYFKYYSFSLNNIDHNQVTKILRETRFRAMKNPHNSNYGIYLNSADSEIIGFRDTYTPGHAENISLNLEQLEISDLNIQPTPGITNTIIFENRTGKTQNTGSFKISNDNFEYTFTINLQGAFE